MGVAAAADDADEEADDDDDDADDADAAPVFDFESWLDVISLSPSVGSITSSSLLSSFMDSAWFIFSTASSKAICCCLFSRPFLGPILQRNILPVPIRWRQ